MHKLSAQRRRRLITQAGRLVRRDPERTRREAVAAELGALRPPLEQLVILADADPLATANAYAELLPLAQILVLDAAPAADVPRPNRHPNVRRRRALTAAAAVKALRIRPRPDAIVDLTSGQAWSAEEALRELAYFVREGGLFLSAGAPSPTAEPSADDDALAAALEPAGSVGELLVHRKTGAHRIKLRDATANVILAKRYGDAWGEVLERTPAREFASRATLSGNRPDVMARVCPPTIKVPELSLRRYRDVHAQCRQVLYDGEFFLPETFRHPRQFRLHNRHLHDVSPTFAAARQTPVTRSVAGPHYYLDTEYPSHFGHVSGEMISRLPAYLRARELCPELKVVTSVRRPGTSLPAFQLAIFAAVGIAPADIEIIQPDETVSIEEVYAATPLYSNSHRRWIAPEIAEIWALLREQLASGGGARPARLFISRPADSLRSCTNGEAVEEVFAAAGFEIVFPDQLPFADQVDMFAHAEVIAGFGGSGMFNMIYARRPGVRIVIASANFTCNEYMFSSVLGDDFHGFWQEPRVARELRRWTSESYQSQYEFDFDADGRRLAEVLATL